MQIWFTPSLLVALTLVLLGLGAAGYAQAVATQPVPPTVLSGADVGFRVEGIRGTTPVGRIVVRVNGQWVEADFSAASRSLGTR